MLYVFYEFSRRTNGFIQNEELFFSEVRNLNNLFLSGMFTSWVVNLLWALVDRTRCLVDEFTIHPFLLLGLN